MRYWIAALPLALGFLAAPAATPAQAQDLGTIIQQIAPGILGGQQQQQPQYDPRQDPRYRDDRRGYDDERARRRA